MPRRANFLFTLFYHTRKKQSNKSRVARRGALNVSSGAAISISDSVPRRYGREIFSAEHALCGQRDAAPRYASYSQKTMAKHSSSHNYCKWISEHIFRIKVNCLLIQPQSGASQTLRLPAALFDCYIRATKQQVETFEYIFLFSFSLISHFFSLLSSSSITLTYIIMF